jgi:sugar phosphate isomerase/epimerase
VYLRLSILTALAVCTFAVPSRSADEPAKRDDSASEKLGIKLSLQCYTYRALTWTETSDRAARLGVKYLEIYPGQILTPGSKEKMDSNMSEAAIALVKKKLQDNGQELVAYGVAPIPSNAAEARKRFEWAKMMGLKVLVTETHPKDIPNVDKLCEEFNIRVALHNHPKTWPSEQVLAACEGHGKLVGSCSDTGHWMRADRVPVEQFKKLEGRVEHSHFKDLNEFGMKAHDLPWGTGRGDAKGMLTELKRQGYKGYLSIEYEFGDVKHLDTNLPKCVAFFDQTMAELAK